MLSANEPSGGEEIQINEDAEGDDFDNHKKMTGKCYQKTHEGSKSSKRRFCHHRGRKSGKHRNNSISECESISETQNNCTLSARTNSLYALLFNKMCDKAEKAREIEESTEERKDVSRCIKKCLRKGLKLDVEAASHYAEDRLDKVTQVTTPNNMKIETRNRFRSLRSKPVDVEEKKSEIADESTPSLNVPVETSAVSPRTQSLKDREVFHDTFSFLIRLGSTEKSQNCRRQMSHEETRWQNELKDLIWLELQAHHADRTPMAQDEYLCKQREAVDPLLQEIMQYRYTSSRSLGESVSLSSSADSGIETPLCHSTTPNFEQMEYCVGCLSMYCKPCMRDQFEALKQVESLLTRLEAAETLYPSSQAFATHYPLYKSAEFTGRVRAMCLWYNMTKHHRLKLGILGKLLMMMHLKKKQEDNVDSSRSSGISSRGSDTTESSAPRHSLITFEISPSASYNSSNPSDSVGSDCSSQSQFSLGQSWPSTPESTQSASTVGLMDRFEYYLTEFDRQAYRKYIEDVLKTRGLGKSLNFLERLHVSLLRKARLALEKHEDFESGSSSEEYEGDYELKRYGAWSSEAKELNLPSYRAAFVFLSQVPLDVIHEFLRMRLEQKPDQPSPLSVCQLMRELREGLRIACIHRDRFGQHMCVAVSTDSGNLETVCKSNFKAFDESLRAVFDVYLDYLQSWLEMVKQDSAHKNYVEEWAFVTSIVDKIPDAHTIAITKFCRIACTMVSQVKDFLIERPNEIKSKALDLENTERLRSILINLAREWQGFFVTARDRVIKCVSLARSVQRDVENWPSLDVNKEELLDSLRLAVRDLRGQVISVISTFQQHLDQTDEPSIEIEKGALKSRIREILHQAYRMGFEYHKELCKLYASGTQAERLYLARSLVEFALLWMDFVKTRCERGRGLRPRWANQGLEYLMIVCEPSNTKHLTEQEFDELKTSMDRCISHVVGTAPVPGLTVENDATRKFSRSRAASPAAPQRARTSSFSMPQKARDQLKSPEAFNNYKSKSPLSSEASLSNNNMPERRLSRVERVAYAIENLEQELDEKLRTQELIGSVTDRRRLDRVQIKASRVKFTWQRGIKIGQGRFGKVYTVVNNQTGELLAMKEVQIQPGDHRAIRQVMDELEIFEQIQHKHLVHYYGLEVHKEELLIFMEFCAEGTLESLIIGSGNGLPESLVRKYAHQLLLAVQVLHSHGIVHRDIKTANIFLTDEGNCLKLGDFGSAVQIKTQSTMPGELRGFVGTQAYMAPEVFMKNESGGHGRAADIWSVGCCVIEMASGRRPWSEYDSNYQIMFKVGMGESPVPPKHLSAEGHDFLDKCLQHDPKRRCTADSLLSDPFARCYEEISSTNL